MSASYWWFQNIDPPDQKFEYFLSFITDLLAHYLKNCEDFIVICDFNESETSAAIDSFLDEQKIKNKACFKSVKESCIDQTDRVYINLQTYLRQELATITF